MANVNQHHKKTRMIAVAALVVGVLGMGVAFAALSTTLNINGAAKIKNAAWDIHWASLTCAPTGEAAVVSSSISKATKDGDTVNVSAEFKANGDTVVCTMNAVNDGTLDAELTGFANSLTNLTAINVTSTLVYDAADTINAGGTPADGDALAKKTSRPMKLTLTYTGNLVAADSDSKTFTYALPYVQANV
jgi:hypothetical protein